MLDSTNSRLCGDGRPSDEMRHGTDSLNTGMVHCRREVVEGRLRRERRRSTRLAPSSAMHGHLKGRSTTARALKGDCSLFRGERKTWWTVVVEIVGEVRSEESPGVTTGPSPLLRNAWSLRDMGMICGVHKGDRSVV